MAGRLRQFGWLSGVGELALSSHKTSRRECPHSSLRSLATATRHIAPPSNAVFHSSNRIRLSVNAVAQPSFSIRIASNHIWIEIKSIRQSVENAVSSSKTVLQSSLAVGQTTSAVGQSSVGNFSPFTLKTSIYRSSRGHEAQMASKTKDYSEPPHVGCYLFPFRNKTIN